MLTNIITIVVCFLIIILRLVAIFAATASLICTLYEMSYYPPKWLEKAYDFIDNLLWWG